MTIKDKITCSPARVVIAGNPNSGKTTLFNALTGLRYKVGNYPGVTVERKIGSINLSENERAVLVDVPGIYTLSNFSEDEQVATKILFGSYPKEAPPDIVIAVIDCTNLERNLYFLSQLIDFGYPIVVALTMGDLANKVGIQIHSELLAKELDLPIVPIHANKKHGLEELKSTLLKTIESSKTSSKKFTWCKDYPEVIQATTILGNKIIEAEPSLPKSTATLLGLGIASDSFFAHSNKQTDKKSDELTKVIEETKQIISKNGLDPLSFDTTLRYIWANKVFTRSSQVQQATGLLSEKIDKILTNRVSGFLTFILLMAMLFQSIFIWAVAPMEYIASGINFISQTLSNLLPEGSMFSSLVVDGIVAGVGNVLVFVPQIAILFFLLSLLEDSGYLARAAYVMDRVMRPFGLQGRSFIPLLSSFACAIPGILSTRTIASKADRLATILIAPLMSCSARLPVYSVLISACIPSTLTYFGLSAQGITLLGMYLLGVVVAAIVSLILKLTILKGEPALFVMEMPPLRRPSLTTVFYDVYDRVRSFIKDAGTMILACSIVLWFLASFPKPPAEYTESPVRYSMAGRLGSFIEPAIKPLGFNWEIGISLIASFAAREVFISSLATIYQLDAEEDQGSLIAVLKRKNSEGSFTTRTALSLMVFYVFACQCMSTLAVTRRETGSWSWVVLMFSYMTILAWSMSYLTYNYLLL